MKNHLALIFTVFALCSLSCEKDRSGVVDIWGTPPYVRSATLNTYYVHIDTTSSGAVTHLANGTYKVTIALIAHVGDPKGINDIKQVSYKIYTPVKHEVARSGNLSIVQDNTNTDEAMYSTNASFTMERSSTGIYIVEMYAQGMGNVTSNSIQLSFLVEKNSGAPRLFDLSMPDTVVRPPSGYFNKVYFRVTAADPDGLADIQKVYFRSLNSTLPNEQYSLSDDGDVNPPNERILSQTGASGDSVAGDGRYARIIPIFSGADLGTKLFRFYAIDKSGFLGDSLDHTITIVQ
jgi:hypothetical protein